MSRQEDPLIDAIRLKEKAKKCKAHPKIIQNLQNRIKDRAAQLLTQWSRKIQKENKNEVS